MRSVALVQLQSAKSRHLKDRAGVNLCSLCKCLVNDWVMHHCFQEVRPAFILKLLQSAQAATREGVSRARPQGPGGTSVLRCWGERRGSGGISL